MSSLVLNERGFLASFDAWSEEVARELAAGDGMAVLGEAHWRVLNYLRGYYREFETAPRVRKLCRETGITLDELFDLFPEGPGRHACRWAGLPSPTGCE